MLGACRVFGRVHPKPQVLLSKAARASQAIEERNSLPVALTIIFSRSESLWPPAFPLSLDHPFVLNAKHSFFNTG